MIYTNIFTGGYDWWNFLSSVEMYKTGDSTTTTLPSLNKARDNHGCSLFTTSNGDIHFIVTGGLHRWYAGGYTTSSVEISTKTEAGWSNFVRTDNALPGWRSHHTTTQIGHLLYTVGGIPSSSGYETSIWAVSYTHLTLPTKRIV